MRRYDAPVQHRLKPHPDTPPAAAIDLAVEVTRASAGLLRLRYVLTGALSSVVLPACATSARTDELWRHTCFEAFARSASGPGYVELNLAPSTQWAAYRFDGYRAGMAPASVSAPTVDIEAGDGFVLAATLDLGFALPRDATWRLGLTAVIEETGGRMSYWALAHAPGKPDFHHADCFALQLPPPDRP